ncbi:hypothetical protein AHAS_Ahas15G0163400 [Arachis hypogaea]
MFHIHQQTQVQHLKIELYVEFEHIAADGIQHDSNMQNNRVEVYEEMNSDSKEDFEATYKVSSKLPTKPVTRRRMRMVMEKVR